MNPRLLFAIDSPNDLCEGYFFREVLNLLLRQDLDIHVVVLQPNHLGKSVVRSISEELGIKIRFVPKRFRNDLGCAISLRRIAKRFGATLIHSWGQTTTRIVGLASWHAPWKYVANKFNLLPNQFLDRLAFERSNKIVVNHPSIQSMFVDGGCRSEQICVLSIGAPDAKFDQVDNALDELRERFNLTEDLFLIGAKAEFVPLNRLKDLLWATDLLQTIRSDFRFLLFGDGPQMWRLKRFAKQSHADRKTIFLPPTENVLPWFRELDLYWHAFEHDPHPFEIAAATRGGCPTLGPMLLGETGAIQDAINGLLFEVGQRDQIARITNGLLNEPEKLQALKASTLQSAESSAIEDTVSNLMDIYREVI